jgi:uncharacterized protein (DUF58 family)
MAHTDAAVDAGVSMRQRSLCASAFEENVHLAAALAFGAGL